MVIVSVVKAPTGCIRINRAHIFQRKALLHENGRNKSHQNVMKCPLVAVVGRDTNPESHCSSGQLLVENRSKRQFFVLCSGPVLNQ